MLLLLEELVFTFEFVFATIFAEFEEDLNQDLMAQGDDADDCPDPPEELCLIGQPPDFDGCWEVDSDATMVKSPMLD